MPAGLEGESTVDPYLCGITVDYLLLLLVELLLSLQELGLDVCHDLLLQAPDGVLEGSNLPIVVLDTETVLVQLLLVGGQLHPFGLELVAIVLKDLIWEG